MECINLRSERAELFPLNGRCQLSGSKNLKHFACTLASKANLDPSPHFPRLSLFFLHNQIVFISKILHRKITKQKFRKHENCICSTWIVHTYTDDTRQHFLRKLKPVASFVWNKKNYLLFNFQLYALRFAISKNLKYFWFPSYLFLVVFLNFRKRLRTAHVDLSPSDRTHVAESTSFRQRATRSPKNVKLQARNHYDHEYVQFLEDQQHSCFAPHTKASSGM